MRLTEKDKNGYHAKQVEYGWHTEEINKLGRLEDIEDKLGVDLVTAMSLMLYGCYVRDYWANKPGVISHFLLTRFPTRNGFWARYGGAHEEHYFKFCQRGETWALTKEELEEKE